MELPRQRFPYFVIIVIICGTMWLYNETKKREAAIRIIKLQQRDATVLVRKEKSPVMKGMPEVRKPKEADNKRTHAQADIMTKININRANLEELTNIPHIGPAKAEAIIRYRKEHGTFKMHEDLLKVHGIGEKTLQKIKNYIEL